MSAGTYGDATYRFLVPHAPHHKRTDRDLFPALGSARAATLNVFRARPGVQRPRLISSWAGSIDSLLLSFPSYGVHSPELTAGYRSVINSMRAGTRFVVVHHESDRQAVAEWFRAAGHPEGNVAHVPMPDYVDFTDWAEDAYLALVDADDTEDSHTYLLEPWSFPRSGDSLIADSVEEFTSVRASQAPLVFQGGNCLVGDDFWLLGTDYFLDTLDLIRTGELPVSVPEGRTEVEFARELFGRHVDSTRELHLVGTKRPLGLKRYYATVDGGEYFLDLPGGGTGDLQPIFHIDMFVTLAGPADDGRFRVLVGSPALADSALGTKSPFALQAAYDEIAADLEQRGFAVGRNPLVHRPEITQRLPFSALRDFAGTPDGAELREVVAELAAAGAQQDTSVQVRSWHHITWNNCLVENSSRGKRVYLPTFGHGEHADLAVVDDEMDRLWTGLGFSVVRLADFNAFASRLGVVHCIKKYLSRGE
ncbi:hypothetical protein SAMN05216188_10868 [Lentzea xinjiangensis]|uniref:Uncharacterized protein n=1 Tax=Lentzea xinjiangensis TaxID=402600 RepID=A0A1H9LRL0_9PSEU|nr:hypothetical protein [Lentzea xinjiangensis]SER14121.1 hypothetical protein SAMN05216188_10868 [Lentzea xinjiangensis]